MASFGSAPKLHSVAGMVVVVCVLLLVIVVQWPTEADVHVAQRRLSVRSLLRPVTKPDFGNITLEQIREFPPDPLLTQARWETVVPTLDELNQTKGWHSVLDLSSGYGALSLSIAQRYPTMSVFSVQGSRDENQNPEWLAKLPVEAETLGPTLFHSHLAMRLRLHNNVVCQSAVSVSLLAALQINKLSFDYILALDVLHAWNLKTTADVELVLGALLKLARVTALQLPVTDLYDIKSIIRTVRSLGGEVDQLSSYGLVHGVAAEPILIIRSKVAEQSDAMDLAVCKLLFTLFECQNSLTDSECPSPSALSSISASSAKSKSNSSSNSSSSSDSSSTADGSNVERKTAPATEAQPGADLATFEERVKQKFLGASARKPKPIPKSVCGTGDDIVVELVKDCGMLRSPRYWVYENDGWYKCRNSQFWLSGCQRMF